MKNIVNVTDNFDSGNVLDWTGVSPGDMKAMREGHYNTGIDESVLGKWYKEDSVARVPVKVPVKADSFCPNLSNGIKEFVNPGDIVSYDVIQTSSGVDGEDYNLKVFRGYKGNQEVGHTSFGFDRGEKYNEKKAEDLFVGSFKDAGFYLQDKDGHRYACRNPEAKAVEEKPVSKKEASEFFQGIINMLGK